MTTVGDLGEFGLIARLRDHLGPPGDPGLLVGPGDDAAVWRAGAAVTVATTDTMVAGVHFLPASVRWQDVGWKALAVNVSDIAAMGALPRFALVTLALPPDTPLAGIDALYDGLRECAAAFGVTVAGGDIVSAPVFSITIALTGDAHSSDGGTPLLLRRDAARIGDVVAITGALGGSAAGLRALVERIERTPAVERLIARHMRPLPRIDAGQAAIAAAIRCGIDVSDGLVQDLGHICDASGVAAVVQVASLPIDPDLVAVFPADPTRLAATGGEDYELLLVAPSDAINALGRGVHVTVVGEIVAHDAASNAARVRCVDAVGAEADFGPAGWDHLAQGQPS
jgi:thiamine-monophosphate kinase